MQENECSACHSEASQFFDVTAYDGEEAQLCELCYSSPLGFLITYKNHSLTTEDVVKVIGMSHNLLMKKLEEINVNAQGSKGSGTSE